MLKKMFLVIFILIGFCFMVKGIFSTFYKPKAVYNPPLEALTLEQEIDIYIEEIIESKVTNVDETVLRLIWSIAVQEGVPPYFVQAIALTENTTLNPNAVNKDNKNGSLDLGVMQLNSNYFGHIDWKCPDTNIRAGVAHIKYLLGHPDIHTYWGLSIAYNAGIGRIKNPPESSLTYADDVMIKFTELCSGYVCPVIQWDGINQRYSGRYF